MPCWDLSFLSSDNTIDITKVWCTVDIKSNCCNNSDEKLAAAAWCDARYAVDLFKAKPWSIITVEKSGCDILIGSNLWTLIDQDKKVSVDWSCAAAYLENNVLWQTWVRTFKNACKMVSEIDQSYYGFDKIRGARRMPSNFLNETIPVWTEPSFKLTWFTATAWVTAMVAWSDNIVAMLDWHYVLRYEMTAEVNDAIHAIRLDLVSSNNKFNWIWLHKYGGWYWSWDYWNWAVKLPLFNSYNGGWNMIMTFKWAMVLPYVKIWNTFEMRTRISAVVDASYRKSTVWKVRFVGNAWTAITPAVWWWIYWWANFSLEYIGNNTNMFSTYAWATYLNEL